ncbi:MULTISPECIES: hypothetical protein [unclassified Paenibacillus]|uniref:hypothetical protein n=1 Tax=unclassified Paenibacillus TaxID=185978 RepID=UPI00089A5899|nr:MULTISPECIES: hypothetical protein [unclassified Paenibacillus]OMC68654.1 hypothetical protein BK126_12565 [Paenibacillus sp. FSL H7-0326]SDW56058.1 hypothetical protein SAMN05518848_102180 [Paenibacillus sp. PDC88]
MARGGRGRPSEKNNIIYFREQEFLTDLKRELKAATMTIRQSILAEALANARKLDMREKKTVRIEGQAPMSDRDRRNDMIASIVALQTEWMSSAVGGKAQTLLKMGVGAMEQNSSFKRSYVGLYYEYGIGGKQDPSGYWIEGMADPNPWRSAGQPSVTRSVFQPKDKKGRWRDLGGNTRVTNSPRGGERRPVLKRIGQDFKGEFWFRKAFTKYSTKKFVLEQYRSAISKVDPRRYLVAKKTFTLGKD